MWNSSCENPSRAPTSLTGLVAKWLPSTWKTCSFGKRLFANSPHSEKGWLMTALAWRVSSQTNTQAIVTVEFPICKWPEGTLRHSRRNSPSCTWHRIRDCIRKMLFPAFSSQFFPPFSQWVLHSNLPVIGKEIKCWKTILPEKNPLEWDYGNK